MIDSALNPAVHVPLLFVAASLLALGVLVFSSRPYSIINQQFAAFTILTSIWTVSIAQLRAGDHVEFWARVSMACGPLISSTVIAFVSRYPSALHSLPRAVTTSMTWLAIIIAAICMTTSWVIYDVATIGTIPSRKSGPLYPLFALYIITAWIIALFALIRKWRAHRGLSRLRLSYIVTGIGISLSGAVITNLILPLVTYRSTYSGIGPYFAFAFVLIACHAIIRHRLMDLRVVVHRGLTLAIATLVSLIPVAALAVLVTPRLSLHFTSGEMAVGIVAALVVSLVIPVTRDAASWVLDRYVYRKQANYRRTVREASRALTRVLHLKKLVDFMQTTIAGAVECDGVALYLRRGASLQRGACERRPADVAFGSPDELPAALLEHLHATRDLLLTEELLREPTSPASGELHTALAELNWALILPAMSENTVVGAIVLGPKRSGDAYYPQDLDLLMTLANQAGIAIKNAQLYAQVVLANEYLESIVATITSGVVAIDGDGVITMCNPAAERLTGLTSDAVRGARLDVLPACLADTLTKTLTDGATRTQPEVDLSADAVTRPVMCTSSPLCDPDGALLGALAVFSDLTPVRELEMQRRRIERLAYLETFASGIGHEVKNPLVAIKTFAQLIPRRRGDEQFVDEFSRVVTREIGRMERLVERLRTLARPGQRPRRLLDVRQPLVDALEFMQASFEEKGVCVEAALGEVEAPVVGDSGELEQLFLNLLMNAQEATPRCGRITVAVARSDGRVSVSVTDTGCGIPAETLTHVFEPFFSTKERGSGLGLAISAGIADAHGARLRAENVTAGGACFTVEFPLATEVSAPVAS